MVVRAFCCSTYNHGTPFSRPETTAKTRQDVRNWQTGLQGIIPSNSRSSLAHTSEQTAHNRRRNPHAIPLGPSLSPALDQEKAMSRHGREAACR